MGQSVTNKTEGPGLFWYSVAVMISEVSERKVFVRYFLCIEVMGGLVALEVTSGKIFYRRFVQQQNYLPPESFA